MYAVNRRSHESYGSVVEIIREENGALLTPFQAVQFAYKSKRIWQESGVKKIRFLIDGQVMSTKQIEQWSNEEYKTLPKCEECAQLLSEDIFTQQLSDNGRFCSQNCADANYLEAVEKLKDEEEIDYL